MNNKEIKRKISLDMEYVYVPRLQVRGIFIFVRPNGDTALKFCRIYMHIILMKICRNKMLNVYGLN